MSLTIIWGCKKILYEQDPGVLTPSQSYKASLIHTGIGRHPIKGWIYICIHILILSLPLSLTLSLLPPSLSLVFGLELGQSRNHKELGFHTNLPT